MTKYAITVAASLFAAAATAHDVYRGLANGNPELFDEHRLSADQVAVQPGVGDSFDVYRGLARGNPDLFKTVTSEAESGPRPDIYQGFGDSPDLSY